MSQATKTGNYSNLMRFYSRTFDSYANICATFKVSFPTDREVPPSSLFLSMTNFPHWFLLEERLIVAILSKI